MKISRYIDHAVLTPSMTKDESIAAVKEGIALDDKRHFEATYDYGDTRLTKPLKQKGRVLILDKSIFEVDGKQLEPRDIIISIDYITADSPIPTLAKEKVDIIYIPDVLE